MRVGFSLSLIIVSVLGLACTSGPCRNLAPTETQLSETQSTETQSSQKIENRGTRNKRGPALMQTVEVAVADGSLQCESKSGKPIEVFRSRLINAGIEVFSEERKPDGLMRIQKCGAPTGQHFVFKISAADLDKALSLGFIRWEW
jgi:hypothetical protein